MPRSTMASRHQAIFDKFLELRDLSGAAIFATTAETALAFDGKKYKAYRAVIPTTAYTGYSTGSAQWDIAIQVSDTAGGTYVTVASTTLDGTNKTFEIPLSGAQVEARLATAAYMRANATKTGSPGNLSYGCFITKAG